MRQACELHAKLGAIIPNSTAASRTWGLRAKLEAFTPRSWPRGTTADPGTITMRPGRFFGFSSRCPRYIFHSPHLLHVNFRLSHGAVTLSAVYASQSVFATKDRIRHSELGDATFAHWKVAKSRRLITTVGHCFGKRFPSDVWSIGYLQCEF